MFVVVITQVHSVGLNQMYFAWNCNHQTSLIIEHLWWALIVIDDVIEFLFMSIRYFQLDLAGLCQI